MTMTYRGCLLRSSRARRDPTVGTMMVTMEITEDEHALRRETIDQARASSALEGQRSSDVARADQDAYVRGEIDIDELLERVRRYP